MSRFRKLLQITLPWLICVALFTWLFRMVSPQAVAQAWSLANKPALFFWATLYFLAVLILDTLAFQNLLGRFGSPIKARELGVVRCWSYLIMILNLTAAQGAFAVLLNRARGLPIARTLAVVAFVNVADLLMLATSAGLALGFSDLTVSGVALRPIAWRALPVLYLGFLTWVIFWRWQSKQAPAATPNRWQRFVNHDGWSVFRQARFKDYAVLFAWRLPLLIIILSGYNWGVSAFAGKIPWDRLFLFMPVSLFLSAIPLTPAGLGTGQALAIAFFKTHIESPLISSGQITAENLLLTSSLAWSLMNQALKVVFGTICVLGRRRFLSQRSTVS